MRIFLCFLFSSLGLLYATDPQRSIGAHLLLHDHEKAFVVAREAFQANPNDLNSHKTYLHALASARDERSWITEWIYFKERYPEEAYDPKVLEQMAWSLLERASKASSNDVRQLGLIAAGLTRDVKSIPLILRALSDGNAAMREIAVEMARLYGDAPLKKGLITAYEKEKIRKVRISMIQAFGHLKMKEMMPSLLASLEEGNGSTEEQWAIVAAVLQLTEKVDRRELLHLAYSERSALRILASEVIAKYQMHEEGELLWSLVEDGHPLVSATALKALGLLRISQIKEYSLLSLLTPFLESPEETLSITASWLAKLHDDKRGEERLIYWITFGNEETKALAAAAISALGSYGVALAERLLDEVDDPFVRANLGLALVGERHHETLACQIFAELLRENKERWMAEPVLGGLFAPLKKSNLPHRRGIAHYPEVVSQIIKLQMASLLAVLEYEEAQSILKEFLSQKNWQVTSLAAELLLEEGDEEALICIRELLQDKDPLIVLEAALVLAVWGHDESALPYLLEGYKGAKIETKVKILEALSRIQEKKSTIPFLVECMREPSYLLRIIAASILLQTMNH